MGRHNRRGAVLVGVMIIVAMTFTLTLTFLGATATVTSVTQTSESKLHARLIAESGLSIAKQYIASDNNWRQAQPSDGAWLTGYPLFDGTVSIDAAFDAADGNVAINIPDASFENASKTLPTPLLFPPMSGTVGSWKMTRKSLLGTVTGLTVPQMGVRSSGNALEGMRMAWVTYPTSVIGWASFSQTLNETLEPNSSYVLRVAAGTAGLAALTPEIDIRIYSGATLMASSSDQRLLTLLDFNADFKIYEVRFTTGDSPPTDDIRVELYTQSLLGVLTGIAFDDVQLVKEVSSPVQLIVEGKYRGITHTITAMVQPRSGSVPSRIVWWQDH